MRFLLILILSVATCSAQTVSYWFQGWQRKPDAEQAAAYFMVPGANVYFTYANNRVIINSGVVPPPAPIPFVWDTDGIDVYLHNPLGAGGSVQIGDVIPAAIKFYPNGDGSFTNNVFVNNILTAYFSVAVKGFFGNGAGISNVHASSVSGVLTNSIYGTNILGTIPTVGLTITQSMTDFVLGAITNVYSNGLLVLTGAYVPPTVPLLGAGGDALIGAGGDDVIGAGG